MATEPMYEAFSVFAVAEEATPGVLVTPPTHYLPLSGAITWEDVEYFPEESRGTRMYHRSKLTHRQGIFEAGGSLDPLFLPRIMRTVLNGTFPLAGVAVGATVGTFLYEGVRIATALNEKTWSSVFGDQNADLWAGRYTFINGLVVTGSPPTKEGTVELTMNGESWYPQLASGIVLPAQTVGSILTAANAEVWIDTVDPIGTTPFTEALANFELTLPSGVVSQRRSQGPGLIPTWTKRGVTKARPTLALDLEYDPTLYLDYEAGSETKIRLRCNGPIIENAGGIDYYEYVDFDIYGLMKLTDRPTENGSVLHQYTTEGKYNAAIASDLRVAVQLGSATV